MCCHVVLCFPSFAGSMANLGPHEVKNQSDITVNTDLFIVLQHCPIGGYYR